MAMVFCRECGNLVHDKAKECLNCGTAQPAAAPQKVRAAAPRPYQSYALVWVLAFAPVLGVLIEMLLANVVHGGGYGAERALAGGYYLWVTVLLNVALCLWDARRLKKAGVDTAAFGPAFLVPIYLFKRARVLGHQPPAYFIGWMVCFCLVLVY